MRKQTKEDFISMKIKDLVVEPRSDSDSVSDPIKFTVQVPGRLVEWNNVVGSVFLVCNSTSGWRLHWVVQIIRNGKMIQRSMKNTPLSRKIQKVLEVAVMREIKNFKYPSEDLKKEFEARIAECCDWQEKCEEKVRNLHAESNRTIQKMIDAESNPVARLASQIKEGPTGPLDMPEFLKR